MSKMKEIDKIAEYLHEVMLENLDDSIDWAVDGIPEIEDLEGDDYNEMKKMIMVRTIEYMLNWMEVNHYKPNTK
jgi:hypothetical protein